MSCGDVNWLAGWVILGIGVFVGMLVAAIMGGNGDEDGGR